MDSITIGFSRPKFWLEPFSWLIRLFEGTPYSHVYIRFHEDVYDRDLVFQASSLQINFFNTDTFYSDEVVDREFVIPVTAETKKAVVQFALDKVGLPYNISGVFGVFLVWLAMRFGKRIANPISGQGDFCSQLVGQILTELLGDKLDLPLNLLKPKDIFVYLDNHSNGQ